MSPDNCHCVLKISTLEQPPIPENWTFRLVTAFLRTAVSLDQVLGPVQSNVLLARMNVSVSDVGIKQSHTRRSYCWGYLVQPVLINGVQQFIMRPDTTLIHTILCTVRGGGPPCLKHCTIPLMEWKIRGVVLFLEDCTPSHRNTS